MSDRLYFRPIVQSDPVRSVGARSLAGGRYWFDRAEVLERGNSLGLTSARDIPGQLLNALCSPRDAVAGVTLDRARLMGIVNVTPDSFSDGGDNATAEAAVDSAIRMAGQGADFLDIGGESTRPGAKTVSNTEETARVTPVISGVRKACETPISIDTRKSDVAEAALTAGAVMLNDVSAGQYDPRILDVAARTGAPICLMHAQGAPETMQDDPRYDDVILDVYDALEARIQAAISVGVQRNQIVIDPGIGFGKTLDHNLRILNNLSLYHGLGCPILLGASRKRFIGTIGDASEPKARMPGSVAVAMAGLTQGVQIFRVHDIAETKQAMALFDAATGLRQR